MVYGSNGKNIAKLEKGTKKRNRHITAIHAANEQHDIWF